MEEDNGVKKIRLNWEEHYQTTEMEDLHWYAEELDQEVLDSIQKFCPGCSTVLDLGTGPGTAAIELTKLGYSVTASDISQAAIDMAQKRAGALRDDIEFVVDDIRDSSLSDKFDIIHDRGCFHVLDETGIKRYLQTIPGLLKESGILLLKTFSTRETDQQGPNRYNYEMIKSIFAERLKILYSEETRYPSTLPTDPRAFFCVMTHI